MIDLERNRQDDLIRIKICGLQKRNGNGSRKKTLRFA